MYLSEVQSRKKLRKRRFYSPYLGQVAEAPSSELRIDLPKAAARNRYFARQLGWGSQFDQIAKNLGFQDRTPDETSFIRAVARWQASQPGLTSDGVIGPNTWKIMRASFFQKASVHQSPAPQPTQGLSPDAAAFMERVLQAHINHSMKRKGRPQPELSESELAPVPNTDVKMRKDAAAAAGRMLAAANQDLSAAKSAGDPDALRTIRISATSGHRSRAYQERLWRGAFPSYYSETATKRESLPGGPHGDAAVQYMVNAMARYIGAPGFSNHQGGIAIDLWQKRGRGSEIHNSRKKQEIDKWHGTWFFRWLQTNAAQFVFRPYEVEPWHWEYRP